MKHLLNTLYITTQGAYLCKEGETVVVKVGDEVKLQVPIHTIGGVVCFGQVSMSPHLMGFCAQRNATITYLTENGRYLASVRGDVSGNVLLRREQYRKADDKLFSADIAGAFIIGKIANTRTVLRRALSDHGDKMESKDLETALVRLSDSIEKARRTQDLDELRGIEGDAARTYFGIFDQLITTQKEEFRFEARNKRPPLDNVNCLLSFIYTILAHDVRSALETVGLDPAVGYLHRDRPGRPGLALDMMEELRPFLADRLVLSLINREQVSAKGFTKSEAGAVLMDDETRKTVIVAYQKRKQEEIMHPYLEESLQIGVLFHAQAMLMARYLRGDIDGYPVFIWK